MKRILITSTELMMKQFLIPHAESLHENGWEVETACSEVGGRLGEVKSLLSRHDIRVHRVDLGRSPLRVRNIKGLLELRQLLEMGRYDTVWTNEPVMGVMTRLAIISLKHRPTVIYMAHGFHFYSGAPLRNWLLYYPIEKWLSRYTDILVTINQEDYKRAKSKFHARKTKYIPGIGVDIGKFSNEKDGAIEKRKELGIGADSIMLLSVGELTARKNHEIVMRALSKVNHQSIHYFIAGKGGLQKKLEALAEELGISAHVHLLGYRSDISELCHAADLFVFPSRQEGCPVALMEAIACRTSVICSRIRGNTELVKDETRLFDENNVGDVARCLEKFCVKHTEVNVTQADKSIELNFENLKKFGLEKVVSKMKCLCAGEMLN